MEIVTKRVRTHSSTLYHSYERGSAFNTISKHYMEPQDIAPGTRPGRLPNSAMPIVNLTADGSTTKETTKSIVHTLRRAGLGTDPDTTLPPEPYDPGSQPAPYQLCPSNLVSYLL
jgi:hypothetical protein